MKCCIFYWLWFSIDLPHTFVLTAIKCYKWIKICQKSVKNRILKNKWQLTSQLLYKTFCNPPTWCKGSVIETVQKRLSTPWNIFYVPLAAISSWRRVGVNFILLWIKREKGSHPRSHDRYKHGCSLPRQNIVPCIKHLKRTPISYFLNFL